MEQQLDVDLHAWVVRPKDGSDFATVLPRLSGSRRRWLCDALALVHPGHPWLEALATE